MFENRLFWTIAFVWGLITFRLVTVVHEVETRAAEVLPQGVRDGRRRVAARPGPVVGRPADVGRRGEHRVPLRGHHPVRRAHPHRDQHQRPRHPGDHQAGQRDE